MTAQTDIDERLLDQAVAWHHALDAEDADWDAYTLWLEADPRHREAFDSIALTDRIVADHADRLRAILPDEAETSLPKRGLIRPWMFGAAAAIAIGIAVPMAMTPAADVTYASGSNPRRVALATGIAVDLAPSTTLLAKNGDTSKLELARGEAYFDVAHDPNRVLAIQAGGYSVSDIGTRFAVNMSDGAVIVSVAQGQVAVDTAGSSAAVKVAKGQQLIAPRGAGTGNQIASLTTVQAANVGSWRHGQLIYSNAPLNVVAADIARYLGKPVDVDAKLSDRRFSGVLAVGDRSKLLPTFARIMGIAYQVDGGRIHITPGPAR